MRRALFLLVVLPAQVPITAIAKGGPAFPTRPYANPGGVIGAEVGFNVAARDQDMATAYKDNAAKDAWLYAPDPVRVADWLKTGTGPSEAASWSPHAVWSSCDGSYAVTEGEWHSATRKGSFLTLWQRQEESGYKWVLRQELATAPDGGEPDMIAATVADCPKRKEGDYAVPPPAPKRGKSADPAPKPFDPASGESDDGTLAWRMVQDENGRYGLTVTISKGGEQRMVVGKSPAA